MKWYDLPNKNFSMNKSGYHARKNNFKFYIKDYTQGWNYKHLGWYVSIEDKETGNKYNSLWEDNWFESLREAKEWCEQYAKKNQNKRIE